MSNDSSDEATIRVRIECGDFSLDQLFALGPHTSEHVDFARPAGHCAMAAAAGNRTAASDPSMDDQVHSFYVALSDTDLAAGIVVS